VPATAEPESERRREVKRHIDEVIMLGKCRLKVTARDGLFDKMEVPPVDEAERRLDSQLSLGPRKRTTKGCRLGQRVA
jgi:hypothetical protein